MGCWNKTCGLSNLHITHGTPVYVFVLEESRDNSNCYSTSLFSPLLLPFESVYNDYGGGEDSSGIALPFVISGIKEQLVEMPLGDNTYHDIEVTREKFDVDLFFEAAHEDRLSIKGRYSKDPTRLQFTMFRKDVVDTILAEREIEEYVGNNKGTIARYGDEKNYIRYKFADIIADIKPMIEEVKIKIAEAKKESETLGAYMLFDGVGSMFEYGHPNLAAKWMRGDSYRYSRIVDMKHAIRVAFESNSPEALNKLEALIAEHLKGVFIDGFMHAARKTWIPGGHEGSQSTSGGALRLLGKAVNDALAIERAQWAKDTGEDESDYTED